MDQPSRRTRGLPPAGVVARPGPAAQVALLALLAVVLVQPGAAHPESAAPELRGDVVAVGHEPAVPAPGQQWTGFIEMAPGHDVERVGYQICKVTVACFGPEHPTWRDGDVFGFDTNDYALNAQGEPVAWGIGDGEPWHVGYKFILHHAEGEPSKFPVGVPFGSDACDALGTFECDATNYFVFELPGAVADRGAPSPGVALLIVAMLAARRMA